MPECLNDANISEKMWGECVKTDEYSKYVNKLLEEQLKSQFLFEDTYGLIQDVQNHIPIKNFDRGYTLTIH